MAPEEAASIDVLASDLDEQTDWDLADLKGGPGLGSRPSVSVDYGCPCKMWSVVSESGSSSVEILLSLATCQVEAVTRSYIMKGRLELLSLHCRVTICYLNN